MSETNPKAGTSRSSESRRRFFKLLAGSPLLAMAYPTLPPEWQREIARVWRPRAVAGPAPAGVACAECGKELVFASGAEANRFAAQQAGKQAVGKAAAAKPEVVVDPDAGRNRYLEGQLTGQVLNSAEEAVNVWDMEATLHSTNLPEHWAYLHMGVNDFETRVANREGFQKLMLRPRRLGKDATKVDTSVQLLGRKWATPLFLCPVAALQAYNTVGECGAARAAKAKGILQIQSNVSSQSYEEIAEARGEPHWFQLYSNPDLDVNKRVLDRVSKAGCPVLVWTIDLLGGSNRELDTRSLGLEGRNGPLCQNCHNHQKGYQRPMTRGLEGPPGPRPPYTWDYIKRLKDLTSMKLIVKGIMTREDAEMAIEQGVDGIYVSNHGGRASNDLRGTIEALPEVVAGVRGRVPVMVDSGVRRGGDIFKALALGATAVGIGRPYVWGLGSFGDDGVARVIDMCIQELTMVMKQTRTTAIDEINNQFVMQRSTPIMMRDNRLGLGL